MESAWEWVDEQDNFFLTEQKRAAPGVYATQHGIVNRGYLDREYDELTRILVVYSLFAVLYILYLVMVRTYVGFLSYELRARVAENTLSEKTVPGT